MSTNTWICDVCGELAEGDMCMTCGNQAAPEGPAVIQDFPGRRLISTGTPDPMIPYRWIMIAALAGLAVVSWQVCVVTSGLLILLLFAPSILLTVELFWRLLTRKGGRGA